MATPTDLSSEKARQVGKHLTGATQIGTDMSTTAYDLQWVTPTAQPYTGTYATYYREALNRGLTQAVSA